MQDITLQDIVTKFLNFTLASPDDLICDAYYLIHEADDEVDCAYAYLCAKEAIEANRKCGTKVPTLEHSAEQMLKKFKMSEADVVKIFLENEEKLSRIIDNKKQ